MSPSTVSIALCTFNGERYVSDQMASLARQTRRPDEIIVGDDGSTDATCEVVEAAAREFSLTCTVVRNPVRLGYSANFDLTRLALSSSVPSGSLFDGEIGRLRVARERLGERGYAVPDAPGRQRMIDEKIGFLEERNAMRGPKPVDTHLAREGQHGKRKLPVLRVTEGYLPSARADGRGLARSGLAAGGLVLAAQRLGRADQVGLHAAESFTLLPAGMGAGSCGWRPPVGRRRRPVPD